MSIMEARSRPAAHVSKDPADEGSVRIWDLRKEGNDDDAILAAEDSLHRAVVSYGPGSEQTRAVATDLVLAYNHLSMKRLAENNIKVGLCGLDPRVYRLRSILVIEQANLGRLAFMYRRTVWTRGRFELLCARSCHVIDARNGRYNRCKGAAANL